MLKQLDGEILDAVEEDCVVEEIEQSDEFKENVYTAIVRVERVLERCTFT